MFISEQYLEELIPTVIGATTGAHIAMRKVLKNDSEMKRILSKIKSTEEDIKKAKNKKDVEKEKELKIKLKDLKRRRRIRRDLLWSYHPMRAASGYIIGGMVGLKASPHITKTSLKTSKIVKDYLKKRKRSHLKVIK